MDIKIISEKIICFLKKYRYAALVLVIGLILITMPTGKEKDNATEVVKQTVPAKQITTEEQLSALLSKIQGAGTVEVMLTAPEEKVYEMSKARCAEAQTGFILAPGCDLPPATPYENIQAMMRAAKE